MASATLISVSEYLNTTYRPDCDLIDGQLVERNMGEHDHSILQGILAGLFYVHRREWGTSCLPEQRVQVKANRFRIPDICVIPRSRPIEQIITHPPLICIEVLSKDDSLRSMQSRVDDYLNFGVPNVWIIDPESRRAWVCDRTGFHEPQTGMLQAADSPIAITLSDLFAELD